MKAQLVPVCGIVIPENRAENHNYFAEVLPEDKANLVQQLQEEGHKVCFVGDGINDSIALKTANVGVSLRGATTIATDMAEIVFGHSREISIHRERRVSLEWLELFQSKWVVYYLEKPL